ncbi:MAG: hypothetical protein MUC74_11340 [Ideonella sp.]|jgi:hypothetical protein|nr:hypothetical protein [Ideonella sp.]
MTLRIDGGYARSTNGNSGAQRASADTIERWRADEQRAAARNTPPRTTPTATGTAPRTAREAVQAIQAIPLPRTDDLNGLSSVVAGAMTTERIRAYNDRRLEAAQEALEVLRPDRSDFAGLNPATANAEYNDAVAAFNADPYVAELLRIEIEAGSQRDTLPAYLRRPEATVGVQGLTVPELRDALAVLGVTLPDNATPDEVAAGFELLASVPQSLMGALINPGMQVRFTTPVAGVGTPGFIPVGAGANLVVEGEVSLSDPQVGIGFAQTQRLDLTLELRGEASAGTQTTTQRSLYVWGSRLERLMLGSDRIREMVQSSPLLRNAVRGLPVGLSVSDYAGSRLSYQAVVTPEQAARIDQGHLSAAPNPFDPLAMPTGTSLMFTGQSLRGSTFEASWKLLRVGTDHTALEGLGFGVRRREGQLVEVFAGPVSGVENELFLGFGRGNFNAGLSVGTSHESQRLQVALIDLSTEEGRAAYQGFVTSGRVPDWNPPGVLRAGEQGVYNSEHESWIGVNAGPLSVGLGGTNSTTDIVETRWQDGSIEQTSTYMLWGVTSEVRFPRDAQGNPVEDQTDWRLMVPGTSSALAGYVHAAFHLGHPQREYDGAQHVQYTFTSDELMALRRRARDYVRTAYGEYGVERMQAIENDPFLGSDTDPVMSMAVAATPEEVFRAIERSPASAGAALLAMALEQQQSMPGRIEIRDAGD